MMDKKRIGFFATLIFGIVLYATSAFASFLDPITNLIRDINPIQIYDSAPYMIDFIIVFAIFYSIAHFGLMGRYGEKSKVLVLALAIALSGGFTWFLNTKGWHLFYLIGNLVFAIFFVALGTFVYYAFVTRKGKWKPELIVLFIIIFIALLQVYMPGITSALKLDVPPLSTIWGLLKALGIVVGIYAFIKVMTGMFRQISNMTTGPNADVQKAKAEAEAARQRAAQAARDAADAEAGADEARRASQAAQAEANAQAQAAEQARQQGNEVAKHEAERRKKAAEEHKKKLDEIIKTAQEAAEAARRKEQEWNEKVQHAEEEGQKALEEANKKLDDTREEHKGEIDALNENHAATISVLNEKIHEISSEIAQLNVEKKDLLERLNGVDRRISEAEQRGADAERLTALEDKKILEKALKEKDAKIQELDSRLRKALIDKADARNREEHALKKAKQLGDDLFTERGDHANTLLDKDKIEYENAKNQADIMKLNNMLSEEESRFMDIGDEIKKHKILLEKSIKRDRDSAKANVFKISKDDAKDIGIEIKELADILAYLKGHDTKSKNRDAIEHIIKNLTIRDKRVFEENELMAQRIEQIRADGELKRQSVAAEVPLIENSIAIMGNLHHAITESFKRIKNEGSGHKVIKEKLDHSYASANKLNQNIDRLKKVLGDEAITIEGQQEMRARLLEVRLQENSFHEKIRIAIEHLKRDQIEEAKAEFEKCKVAKEFQLEHMKAFIKMARKLVKELNVENDLIKDQDDFLKSLHSLLSTMDDCIKESRLGKTAHHIMTNNGQVREFKDHMRNNFRK